WGLSLFAVREDRQSQGIGRKLLDAAVAYGDGARGQIILSTADPRAMRRYARAGFLLRPLVAACAIVDRSRIPRGLRLRPADAERDGDVIARASRHVRGATHLPDIPALLATGSDLLVFEDRGYAVQPAGSVRLLAAVDEAAATDLLWSVLA